MNKLQNLPSIQCVGLYESIDRRANLEKWFGKYNIKNYTHHLFERYVEEKHRHKLEGTFVHELATEAKGANMSHLSTIKNWYYNTEEPYTIVFEDDMSLETVEYWNFTWDDFFQSLPSNWNCIQLYRITEHRNLNYYFRNRYGGDWSAGAYLIKREYAKWIIDQYYYKEDIFSLDIRGTRFIPVIESLLFLNAIEGIYTFPLFTEDCKNTKTTFISHGHDPELWTQSEWHYESYDDVITWWKTLGSHLSINKIMNPEINHIYDQPQFGENWFSYPNLYTSIVQKFPTNSKFVEIGCWKGKSSAFMAVEIARSQKNIEFYCIDTWEGSIEHKGEYDLDSLYDTFISNMKPVENYYQGIRSTSLSAVHNFEDESLDFVFIDASHEYEDVKKDIIAWLPKVKIGGILAGHDYYLQYDYFPGVKQAVNEIFDSSTLELSEDCWVYNKKSKIIPDEKNKLKKYITDTENAQNNFELGIYYKEQNHLAPALSYFLRSAERSDDNLLIYESLLQAFFCYHNQEHRSISALSTINQALLVNPKRPEAYYWLSKFYEKRQDWQNCYIFADLGCKLSEDNYSPLQSEVNYPGKYALLYQKVISGWHWGKSQECRDILKDLVDNYWNVMPENFRSIVELDYVRLGRSKNCQQWFRYNKNNYNALRYKFKNSEDIETNFSQIFQDMFTLSICDGKFDGTFLEVGGSDPFHNNNTALLEKHYNWSGVSIEINDNYAQKYEEQRPTTKLIRGDATKINYKKLLSENYDSNIIDYLQLDIEPAKNTFDTLLAIPLEEYKFRVITFEHDYYADVTQSYRDKSRRYLKSMGYELVVTNVSSDGVSAFEDWWVHPELVSKEILDLMRDNGDDVKKADDYIYNK